MDTQKLLESLSQQELEEVNAVLPAELERRRLANSPYLGLRAIEGGLGREDSTDPTDVKRSIVDQLGTALIGYRSVKNQLVSECSDETQEAQISGELGEWLTDEKIRYITEAKEADPGLEFTLVATPNVLVDAPTIARLARVFGEDRPSATEVEEEFYKNYTAETLSGTNPDNGNLVVFSLVPRKINADLYGTIPEQLDKLAQIKAAYPFAKVPSVLESITYWYTLGALDVPLKGNAVVRDTSQISHFDLPEQYIFGLPYIPREFIDFDGGGHIGGQYIKAPPGAGLVAVG